MPIFFYKVEVAINSLDHTEARSIAKREEMLAKPQIENQIAYITSNFVHLKFAILKLEEKGISLEESTKVLTELDDNLPIWGGGGVGGKVRSKFKDVIEKNKGFKILLSILNILSGKKELQLISL